MQEFIERLFQNHLKELFGEGERLLKVKALSACVRIIQGIRNALMLHYFVTIFCALAAISAFSTVIFALLHFLPSSALVDQMAVPLVASVSALVFSSVMLYFTVREKAWVRAFRVQELVESTLSLNLFGRPEPQSPSGIDATAIMAMVETAVQAAVEAKLAQKSAEKAESPGMTTGDFSEIQVKYFQRLG